MLPNSFHGVRVIESVLAVKDGEPYPVRRTWKDRLFSRPWRPWISVRFVTPKVPAAYQTAYGWVIHPSIVAELRSDTPATE